MEQIEWVRTVERKYTPFCMSLNIYNNSLVDLRKIAPFDVPDKSAHVRDFVFWVKGVMNGVSDYQIEQYNKEGVKFLWNMAKLCESSGKDFLDFFPELNKTDFSSMSDKELAELLKKAVTRFRAFSVFIIIPLSLEKFLDEGLDKMLRQKLIDKDKIEEFHKMLIQPNRLNSGQSETLSLYEIAYEFKKLNLISLLNKDSSIVKKELETKYPKLFEKIRFHLERYEWLTIRWMVGELMIFEDIINRIKVISGNDLEENLRYMRKKIDTVKKEADEIARELKFNDKDKDFVNLVKEYVYLRTYRTDTLNYANHLIRPLIQEIAKRIKLNYKDFLYLTNWEAIEALEKGKIFEKVDIKKRKEDWAFYREGNKIDVYQGKKEVEEMIKTYGIPLESYSEIKEVKGNTAWKGKVRGKAKILMSPEEIGKVVKGDILIAVMTFPSFVPAMEKASAFVTDEGGILCHAAIVSREMKKPCVIGTKIATKIFRDGDEVEVDGDNGIVKVIKRAK